MMDSNVDLLRTTLGVSKTQVDDRVLEELIQSVGGNISQAANVFLDRGIEAFRNVKKGKTNSPQSASNDTEIMVLDSDEDDVDNKKAVSVSSKRNLGNAKNRRDPTNLGSARTSAKSSSKRDRPVVRQWPKRLCALAVDAESTTTMDEGEVGAVISPNMSLKVSFDEICMDKRSGKGRSRKVKQTIVRISIGEGKDEAYIGRLPKWISSHLHLLMKEGVIRATASLQAYFPPSLRPFTQIPILLHLDLLGPSIFEKFPDVKKLNDGTDITAQAFFELCEVINNPLQYGSCAIGATGSLELSPGNSNNEEAGSVLTLSEKEARGIEETLGANKFDGEADDPVGLSVELRPHQRVALRWMLDREDLPQASKDESLWQERSFRDRKGTKYYVNAYTRQVRFGSPPTVEPLRGGILADEMGLGKTVCVIALILASNSRSKLRLADQKSAAKVHCLDDDSCEDEENCFEDAENVGGGKRRKAFKIKQGTLNILGGPASRPGTLVVCPVSLVSQWENEIADKVKEGHKLNVLVFHSDECTRGITHFGQYDCVLTTYGVVASEFQDPKSALFNTQWERVVLDEAHNVKNRTTNASRAAAALDSSFRWCLTGTPLQNSVDDMYALFLFLRHEPWNSYTWWSKIIRIPFEQQLDKEKSAAAMQRLRSVLTDGPVMLRRTKRDVEEQTGTSIAHKLPPKHLNVIDVVLTEAERMFYDAIYSRSKAEFDGLVATGSANSKYAAIFTLLLRMRQACDSPFLVLSSSDSEDGATPSGGKSSKAKAISDREYVAQLRDRLFAANSGSAADTDSSQSSSQAYLVSTLEDVEKLKEQDCPICLDVPKTAVITSCGHVMCKDCLEGTFVYSNSMTCPVCRKEISRLDINTLRLPSQQAEETKQVRSTVEARWRKSSKLELLMQHVQRLKALNTVLCSKSPSWTNTAQEEFGEGYLGEPLRPNLKPVKVLVFSQWTKMLDMIERSLNEEGISNTRLDGSLTQAKRKAAIDRFNSDNECNVFLVSLKAGGVGLNLVSASVVFIVDAWWNPQTEEQAIDRVHRIGQTRPVHVYRMICIDTVEQRILALQERKARMAQDALQDNSMALDPSSQKIQKLSMDDLFELFRA